MTAPSRPAAVRQPVQVVGAASLGVLSHLAGPRRTARVLHAGPDAAYLEVGGLCIGVLGARAVQVPCGVRTRLETLPELAAGREAVVVGGVVQMVTSDGVELDVTVTDLVDVTVPVLAAEGAASALSDLRSLVADRLDAVRALLPADALDRLAGGDASAVPTLLGLGPGLTPLGDDVLAGWLATAVSRRHPGLETLRQAVADTALVRTTTLSATLLACAARGEVVPQFRALLVALGRPHPTAASVALDRLLGIGATSGAGLVLGALLALQPPPNPTASPFTTEEGAAG